MSVYDDAFYRHRDTDTRHAARRILSPLIAALDVRSLVDVGCGVGTWLAIANENGVERVNGVEGPWLEEDHLIVPPDLVHRQDLEQPIQHDHRVDLVICLEVAEHLSERRAPGLVRDLTSLADYVLFGAAIPRQEGDAHINEQWQSWWASLFEGEGFVVFDVVRPAIWDDEAIPFWYRQNTLLYAREGGAAQRASVMGSAGYVDLVHPELFLRKSERPGITTSAKLMARAVKRRLSGNPSDR